MSDHSLLSEISAEYLSFDVDQLFKKRQVISDTVNQPEGLRGGKIQGHWKKTCQRAVSFTEYVAIVTDSEPSGRLSFSFELTLNFVKPAFSDRPLASGCIFVFVVGGV